jgi:hypothetical protein
MQGAVVILMALSGLGCQNKSADAGDLPTSVSPIVSPLANPLPISANPLPSSTIPPPYPSYYFEPDAVPDTTPRGVLRNTLSSFCLGRDRDVRTPREIEASVFGFESGR